MVIESLTPEQEAQLPVMRDEWLGYGLSTQPADRAAAEEGVRQAYLAADLEPPNMFIWFDSPYAGCVAAALLQTMGTIVDEMSKSGELNQLWDTVTNEVLAHATMRADVKSTFTAQLAEKRQMPMTVTAQQTVDQMAPDAADRPQYEALVGEIYDRIWAIVWDRTGAIMDRDHTSLVRTQIGRSAWGQHDAWLSFFDYVDRVLDLECAQPMRGLIKVAQSAGWWWPFQGIAILTERPTELHRNTRLQLHNPTGPALLYPDGWGVWALNGVRVPRDLIEQGWSVERVLAERNAEVRRCAIELMGWDAFIENAKLRLIDGPVDDPGNPGQQLSLYELPDMFDEDTHVLTCTNATPEPDGSRRRFGLLVPATATTALSAAAWGFNLTEEQYAQMRHAY